MALLTIKAFPDNALRRKAEPVSVVGSDVRRMLEDMAETMYANNGIGLAAIQVGIALRLVTIDVPSEDKKSNLIYLVNPVVTTRVGSVKMTEGCLSFPKLEVDVKRAARVSVSYLDENGVPRELVAEGLLAACIQHEIDHLDGVLFIDRLGLMSRRLALREYERLRSASDQD